LRPDPNGPGPVAVVTGAGRGIGRAIALAFAAGGSTVALVGRRPEALAEVAGLVERRGGRAVCFAADLVAPDGAKRVGQRIVQELGATDVLVHGAGIFRSRRQTPLWYAGRSPGQRP
jgi:NAD(P)-dependent dehydrogenase (short-subunit alcohol dehydrogenase family)